MFPIYTSRHSAQENQNPYKNKTKDQGKWDEWGKPAYLWLKDMKRSLKHAYFLFNFGGDC